MGIVGHIDLSKFEKKRDLFLNLSKKIGLLSLKLNREIKNKYQFNDLINSDGSVSMEAFSNKKGGIYEENEIENDNIEIKKIKSRFIKLEKESVRNFYKNKYGLVKDEDILKKWDENRDNQKSSKVEKLITILLNKAMGNRFIIVRTATIDDYVNGVDYLIVDKQTGNVVGAFDGLAENDNTSKTTYVESKEEKVNKIINKGGASIKYGFIIKDDKLEMKSLKNLPIFYLSLNDDSYKKLGERIDDKLDREMKEDEKNIFSDLISSLKTQINNIKNIENINSNLMNNIDQFEKSLKSFT